MPAHTHTTLNLRRTAAVLFAGCCLAAGVRPVQSEAQTSGLPGKNVFHADLAGRANPAGVILITGFYRKWSGPLDRTYGIPASHRQCGVMLGLSPAGAQGSLYGEWKPALFMQARLQYDQYRYFGANGSLLSFPAASAPFGRDELKALKGEEKGGWGRRIILQPVFTAKAGRVIIRNATDLAYYRFDGAGPYFYESEYDTLLKDGDTVADNTTAFLLDAGSGAAALLAGPFYQITHAGRADITRQRLGIQGYWSPAGKKGPFSALRAYGRLGLNLQDRNRDGQLFFTAGMGVDF